MKLPWKRNPAPDLVGEQVVEVVQRDEATRALITPFSAQPGTEVSVGGGILFLPEELGFPTGGSVTASGGWCAPSEAIYSQVPIMVTVPAVQVPRGGISWPAPVTVPARRPVPAPKEWLPAVPVFRDVTAP